MLVFLLLAIINNGNAQTKEAQQLALNIQKLNQMRTMLNQIRNGYQIVSQGYKQIKNISKDDFTIHSNHLNGLLNVSPTVRNYSRVATTMQYQYRLVSECRNSYARFTANKQFSSSELSYMANVHKRLLDQSFQNLQELTTILSSGKTRMSDDERLQAIDRIYLEMENKLGFLQKFNSSASTLSKLRMAEKSDAQAIEKLYGIKF